MSDNATGVIIRFKPAKPIELEIDPDLLTWDDLMIIQGLQGESEENVLGKFKVLLTKLTGQDIGAMPARTVTAIIDQLKNMTELTTPKN